MPLLIVLILGVLILLGGILGLVFEKSIPPLFKVMVGSTCILLVFLLILVNHQKMNTKI
ncbi:hypothetical protein MUO69_04375 [Candidatus Bathyarchaeota archaeon]|nr:hypothetical protein [Candidatus Bathyarchaeota archaeon]